MNYSNAKRAAKTAAPGLTFTRTGFDDEIVIYPRGANPGHPAAYFTTCPRDALDSAVSLQAYLDRDSGAI